MDPDHSDDFEDDFADQFEVDDALHEYDVDFDDVSGHGYLDDGDISDDVSQQFEIDSEDDIALYSDGEESTSDEDFDHGNQPAPVYASIIRQEPFRCAHSVEHPACTVSSSKIHQR